MWTRGDAEFQAVGTPKGTALLSACAELETPAGALYPECIARVGQTMTELEHPDAKATVLRSLELLSKRLPAHRANMEFTLARLLAREGNEREAVELATQAEAVVAAQKYPDLVPSSRGEPGSHAHR